MPVFENEINLKKLAVVVQKRLSAGQIVNFKSFVTNDYLYLEIDVTKLKSSSERPASPIVYD